MPTKLRKVTQTNYRVTGTTPVITGENKLIWQYDYITNQNGVVILDFV